MFLLQLLHTLQDAEGIVTLVETIMWLWQTHYKQMVAPEKVQCFLHINTKATKSHTKVNNLLH